jgi:hypothetical protein
MKSEVECFARDSSNNSMVKMFPHGEYLKADVSVIKCDFNVHYKVPEDNPELNCPNPGFPYSTTVPSSKFRN